LQRTALKSTSKHFKLNQLAEVLMKDGKEEEEEEKEEEEGRGRKNKCLLPNFKSKKRSKRKAGLLGECHWLLQPQRD